VVCSRAVSGNAIDGEVAPAETAAQVAAAATERLTSQHVRDAANLSVSADERAAHTELLRDQFTPVTLDAAWLTTLVVSLAQTIYGERRFDLMPSLGAALSEAGCKEPEILQHCAQGPHVRGCFLLDALLGLS